MSTTTTTESTPRYLTFEGDPKNPEDGIFLWTGPKATKEIPKEAKFLWHARGGHDCWNRRKGLPCTACNRNIQYKWWTNRVPRAARLLKYADKDARRALADHASTVTASKATDGKILIPAPEDLDYFGYQKAGIHFALSCFKMGKRGALLADEMGLGKTPQALGVVNALAYRASSTLNVLVFCPASLRLNWLREAQRWLVRPDWKFFVVEKTTDLPPEDANVVICNYAKLSGSRAKDMVRALTRRRWDILIADEIHQCRNKRTAARGKALLGYWNRKKKQEEPGIIHHADRLLFLTGTPMLNKPIEVQPIVGALDPKTFGHMMRFAYRYCDAHKKGIYTSNGYKEVWDMDGSSNLPELNELLRGTIMCRRLKKDVLTEMPSKTRQIVVLPTNGATREVNRERKKFASFQDKMETLQADMDLAEARGDQAAYEEAVRKLDSFQGVAFTEMAAERHAVAQAKVPYVIEHVDNALDQGVNKVLVFAWHRDVIQKFMDHWGEDAVCLHGGTSMTASQEAVDRFQNDPSVKVFVGNIKAAGVGITLTAGNLVVFAEQSWLPADMSQAEDRAHRLGQVNPVLVQILVFSDSLDAQMAQTLLRKQKVQDQMLDLSTQIVKDVPNPEEAKKSSEYPPASDEDRRLTAQALQILAGMCDGASSEDGMGFNKYDTRVGKNLALWSSQKPLTDGQVWLGKKLVTKYHRQLPQEIVEGLNL